MIECVDDDTVEAFRRHAMLRQQLAGSIRREARRRGVEHRLPELHQTWHQEHDKREPESFDELIDGGLC